MLAALAGVLGPPVDDRPLGSCPSGEADRLVQFGELAVLFGGGRFVAWDAGPPSGALPPLTTAEGIGVGSSVAELRGAYGQRLQLDPDDPFGPVFEITTPPPGRLAGTLTGTGPSDTVASLSGAPPPAADPAENLLELLAAGMTIGAIIEDHADLESDDLLAALEFAALAIGMRRAVPLGAA